MQSTTLAPGLSLLVLSACLPWNDTPFNLSDSLPSGAAQTATEFDPSITTSLRDTTGGEPHETGNDTTDNPPHETNNGTTDGGDLTTATTDDPDPYDCTPIDSIEPQLVFGMSESDYPKIAVGPGCQLFSTGELGDWGDCPVAPNDLGPAYLAGSNVNGTCNNVVPLPGRIGYDVVAVPTGAVVVGLPAEGELQPMVVHVAAEPLPFAETTVGTKARAVTVDGESIVVIGACTDECGGDSLWIARYDLDGTLMDENCHCDLPFRGRAITMLEDTPAVIGESRNTGDRTGVIAIFNPALEQPSTLTLRGSGDDLEPIGVDVNQWGAGILWSATHGLIVSVSCQGPTVQLLHQENVMAEATCETATDLGYGPNGNIAIVRIDDTATIETFGGIHAQHPTAIVLSDDDTLWLAGTIFGAGITLAGTMNLETMLAHLTTVEGAGFIARFDLSSDVTTPTGLYVVDNEESLPSSKTTDIAFDPERQRIVVAGAATQGGCLRPWDGTCADNAFAGSRDFLAFIPTNL